jgi:hypothetical protein
MYLNTNGVESLNRSCQREFAVFDEFRLQRKLVPHVALNQSDRIRGVRYCLPSLAVPFGRENGAARSRRRRCSCRNVAVIRSTAAFCCSCNHNPHWFRRHSELTALLKSGGDQPPSKVASLFLNATFSNRFSPHLSLATLRLFHWVTDSTFDSTC